MGRPVRLFPVPVAILTLMATAVNKAPIARRLCGNLQVDISETMKTLSWVPPLSVDESLRFVSADYFKRYP